MTIDKEISDPGNDLQKGPDDRERQHGERLENKDEKTPLKQTQTSNKSSKDGHIQKFGSKATTAADRLANKSALPNHGDINVSEQN